MDGSYSGVVLFDARSDKLQRLNRLFLAQRFRGGGKRNKEREKEKRENTEGDLGALREWRRGAGCVLFIGTLLYGWVERITSHRLTPTTHCKPIIPAHLLPPVPHSPQSTNLGGIGF